MADPRDVLGIEALQRLGMNPYGSPGFGQFFGAMPGMATLPPGYTMNPGGTFFGSSAPPTFHMNFPSVPYGQAIGMGVEAIGRSQGYNYAPPNVNPMDMMRGRDFEMQMQRMAQMGMQFDENKLARAIASAFKAVGYVGPDASAMANSLANINAPLAPALGRLGALPGGSAVDFAQRMYIASQGMRDFTQDRYALGMPSQAASDMTRQMLDYFSPGGMPDQRRLRGMGLGDMGQLGISLTGMGLIGPSVSQADMQSGATTLGTSLDQMTSTQIDQMRGTLRGGSMAKQLQAYADVVKTMREIMGRPDAPIPSIISNLQQMTGGAMQEMNPGAIKNLLTRVQEVARASNVTMDVMMEIVKSGSTMAQQVGLSGVTGMNISMQAVAATAASQTLTPGAFRGRPTPNQEGDTRFQFMQRGVVSPAAKVSMQAQMLLNDIDRDGLSATQQGVYDQLRKRAAGFDFNMRNIDEARGMFGQIGVGFAESYERLTSNVGISQFLEDNPNMPNEIFGRQMEETITDVRGAARGYLGVLNSKGGSSALRAQVNAAASSSGRTAEQIMDLVGQSYAHAPSGSVTERAEWLKSQGVTGINFERLFGSFERNSLMGKHVQGRGFKNAQQLAYYASQARIKATMEADENVEVGMRGREFADSVGLGSGGGFMDKLFGAMDENPTGSVFDMLARAMNFQPTGEMEEQFKAAGGAAIQSTIRELKGKNLSPERRAELVTQLAQQREALSSFEDRFPGLTSGGARNAGKMADAIGGDVQKLALIAGDKTQSASARRAALTELVSKTKGGDMWSGDQIAMARSNLSPEQRLAFQDSTALMQGQLAAARNYLDELETTTDPMRIAHINKALDEISGDLTSSMPSANRLVREAQNNAMAAGGGAYSRSIGIGSFNRTQELMSKFGKSGSREDLMALRGEMARSGRHMLVKDKDGKWRANKRFVDEVTALDESYVGSPEKRKAARERLTTTLNAMGDARDRSATEDGGDISDEALAALQVDIGGRGNSGLSLSDSALMGSTPAFTGKQWDFITGVDSEYLNEIGTKETNRIMRLRTALTDSAKISGLLAAGKDSEAASLRTLNNLFDSSALFDKDMQPEIARLLIRSQGEIQGGMTYATLQKLKELEGLSAEEMGKEFEKIQKEHEAKKEADEKSDTEGDGSKDGEKGEFTIRITDAETGEELKVINVEVAVPNKGSERGREASNNVIPGGITGSGAPIT